ncbi:hypothetical protein BDV06DRAFT_228186 [Aspergillus oleicola]
MELDTSCDSSNAAYLEDTFTIIQEMLTSTREGLARLNSSLDTTREQLSPGDKAQLDLFMALYGIFDPQEQTAVETAKSQIERVDWFAHQLNEALASDLLDITIFCDDDHLEDVGLALDENGEQQTDVEGRPELIYQSTVIANMVDISMAGKCEENEGLRAFMQNTITNSRGECDMDVLTICPLSWGEEGWSEHLAEYANKDIEEVNGEVLDEIISISAEVSILHELTHTVSFFTEAYVMEDNQQLGGSDAYKWEGCFNLAQDSITQDSALTNAETFAYFNAGLYLSQCNWRNGECQDPSEVD